MFYLFIQKSSVIILTLPLSSSLVIMTIVETRCSQTIRQKSQKVSGNGPCAHMP